MAKLPSVWVLCQNDFPYAVYWNEKSALAAKRRKEKTDPDHCGVKIYWHVNEIKIHGVKNPAPKK